MKRVLLFLLAASAGAEDHHRLSFDVPDGWTIAQRADAVVLVPEGTKGDPTATLIVSGGLPREKALADYMEDQFASMKRKATEVGGKVVRSAAPEEDDAVSRRPAMYAELSYEVQGTEVTIAIMAIDLGDELQQVGFVALSKADRKKCLKAGGALVKSLQVLERQEAPEAKGTKLYVALERIRRRDVRSGNFSFLYVPRTRLLLEDGKACRQLPKGGLAAFDWASAKRGKPEACGTWSQVKGGIELAWSDGEESLEWTDEGLSDGTLVYERCDLAVGGLALEGTWSFSTFTQTESGGVAGEDALTFRRDGTFRAKAFVGHFAGRETPDEERFTETESGTLSGGGTYTIRDGTLELTFEGGDRASLTFYLFPKNAKETPPARIVVDGRSYLRE